MSERQEHFTAARLMIGLDMRPLIPIRSGGIVNAQKGTLQEVFARYPEHRYAVFCTSVNWSMFTSCPDTVERIRIDDYGGAGALDTCLARLQADVLFRSYPIAETLAFPLARQIVYMPDNQHDFLPELFGPEDLSYRRQAFSTALQGAGAIATISEFSRSTLAQRARRGCDIFLMPPALQREHAVAFAGRLGPAETALLPRGNYFYYPANLWPHKNHRRVLAAFREFARSSLAEFAFVLTGDPTGWPELSAEFTDLDIRHLGFVSAGLVARLYRQSTALVFFSLFEGFGVPLLEAFHAGTPVLCSNGTSLPEVAGGAALMADPTDVPAMAAAMRRIATDAALRGELVARGRQRLAKYSWRQTAESFIQACTRVAATARSGTDRAVA